MRLLVILMLLSSLGCAPLPWGAPPTVSGDALSVGDGALHFADEGPVGAPAVLLIHGFGSHLGIWEPVLDGFRGHRVVRVDLLGFGDSSRIEGDYSPEAQADAILALMDALGIARASVVGHSMGSMVALTVAERAPRRVTRLALLSPFVYEDQVPWSYRDARQPGLGEAIVGNWHTEHLGWRLEFSVHDDSLVTEELIDRARSHSRPRGSRAAALATIRSWDLPAREVRYVDIAAPTLIVSGMEDRVVLLPFAERLGMQMPDATVVALPLCGHLPMIEAAVELNGLMAQWLGEQR
ncbi:MAG: alpha/beta fold hydrolase [Deltaproteobacteria bacterium]|nr:alpha/beta fold hydrolase [Deltaproteobacteria bacterium]